MKARVDRGGCRPRLACDNAYMRYRTTLAFLAMTCLPFVSSAATAAELQAQAQALLQQVAALQAQLGAQNGTTPSATSSANCPLIGRVLKRGSSGDDVARLQKFLASDPAIYPEALVTGYYGALTEAAVKRWQAKYNIVSSGTAETTGYGVTGPRTAAAISLQCSTTVGGGDASPTVGGFIQVSPVSGNAPLQVNVTATVNTTASCGSAVYLLDWGDASAPYSIPVSANTCAQLAQTYQHTYIYGGVYIVKLSAGGHETTATVVVSGPSAPSTSAVNLPAALSASPNSGSAPLLVTFTAYGAGAAYSGGVRINYGDGNAATLCNPNLVCGQSSITHSYTSPGTYSASIIGIGPNGNTTLATTQVVVSGSTAPSPSTPSTYPPFALTPSVNGNPLVVSVQFSYDSCAGYHLEWGDGGASNSTPGCSTGNTTSTSVAHTYAAGGTYTVTLKRNAQIDTASVTISN